MPSPQAQPEQSQQEGMVAGTTAAPACHASRILVLDLYDTTTVLILYTSLVLQNSSSSAANI